MRASLRTMIEGTIDYAGLFPPAKLPLDEAIRNYARYRSEPEAWMLGRFICPAARLPELDPYVQELFREGEPLRVTVIGTGGGSADELVASVAGDVRQVMALHSRNAGRVLADSYEVRLPSLVLGAGGHIPILTLLRRVRAAVPPTTPMSPFFEGDWKQDPGHLVGALELHGQDGEPSGFGASGLKLRCGGLDAAAFPTCGQLARALWEGAKAALPMKATAGLHHPIRHYNDSVGTKMHGFVNVFAAAAMAAQDAGEEEIVAVLAEEDPESFLFNDEGMAWRDRNIPLRDIARARRFGLQGFGSCSFDEPGDDLRALGWL